MVAQSHKYTNSTNNSGKTTETQTLSSVAGYVAYPGGGQGKYGTISLQMHCIAITSIHTSESSEDPWGKRELL